MEKVNKQKDKRKVDNVKKTITTTKKQTKTSRMCFVSDFFLVNKILKYRGLIGGFQKQVFDLKNILF